MFEAEEIAEAERARLRSVASQQVAEYLTGVAGARMRAVEADGFARGRRWR